MITWRNDLSVGIKKIDDQHKTLISVIKKLHQSINAGEEAKACEDIMKFLEYYVDIHFREEEYYMEKIGYDGYTAHKNHHICFCELISDFKEKHRDNPNDTKIPLDLLHELSDWYEKHISVTDKRLGDFLKTQKELRNEKIKDLI